MFNWNPFASKPKPAPAQSVLSGQDAETIALLREMAFAKADLLPRGFILDIRPLQRAILNCTFMVPLHEPPEESADGSWVRLKPMTFEDSTMLCVFTGAPEMREFLQSRVQGAGVSVRLMSGQEVCQAAWQIGFAELSINHQADLMWMMAPIAFETLASGRILMGMNESDPRWGQAGAYRDVEVGRVPHGLPRPETTREMRQILASFGASRAIWHAQTVLDREPPEVWVCIATEGVGEEQMPAMTLALTRAWAARWTINTPLRLLRLDDSSDAAIIEKYGEPLFP